MASNSQTPSGSRKRKRNVDDWVLRQQHLQESASLMLTGSDLHRTTRTAMSLQQAMLS